MECTVDKDGVYLDPVIIGRKFFDPIYIPWKKVRSQNDSFLGASFVEVVISNHSKTKLYFRVNDFQKIKKAY